MPANPWLAIDVATPPRKRARELKRLWQRFLGDGRLDSVRTPIADSWRRSHAAGVDPSPKHRAPVLADEDETSARWDVHPLAAALPLIEDSLTAIADESAHLIVVSDAEGILLWIGGNATVRMAAADSMNFTEGALWSENGAGTNAIGTALAADHAVQVFAAEHFNEVVQAWTCAAAPVHDPDTGRLLGIVDLTGKMTTVHPHSLALALTTARAVESQLRWGLHERDDRLRARYQERIETTADPRALVTSSGRVLNAQPEGWLQEQRLELPAGGGELVLNSGRRAFAEPVGHEEAFILRAVAATGAGRSRPLLKLSLLGRDRADAELGGRPIQLSRRHSEVLALLSMRPGGMTGEELTADLYGDLGTSSTTRVEVHRLRKLVAEWIDTDPYRLSRDVESDVARVKGLLDRGAVREAVELYHGPLLPHSEAPGVVRERDTLEAWLRQAVMTADEDDTLWAWVQSASGRDDLRAWKRLLARLHFLDPRRSLAAAEVRRLRKAYAVG
ncbi:MAG TPA: GAF domain-containing protein [Thermoleophilaceae bacterium]